MISKRIMRKKGNHELHTDDKARSQEPAAEETVSHSRIEGSVEAIAQRIYHRIRQRIAWDRQRFGG